MNTNMYSDPSEGNELEIGPLDCARRGWRVVPLHPVHPASSCGRKKCKDICKHALNKNGLDDATLNEQTIHQWWQKWPNANVGVATGEHSGVVVLEVHPEHGGDGSISFLEEIFEELRDTVEIVIEEGTRLLLFSYPDDGPVRVWRMRSPLVVTSDVWPIPDGASPQSPATAPWGPRVPHSAVARRAVRAWLSSASLTHLAKVAGSPDSS